jgi:hypothetical protein
MTKHYDFPANRLIYTEGVGATQGTITCPECLDLIEDFNAAVDQLEDHMGEIAEEGN